MRLPAYAGDIALSTVRTAQRNTLQAAANIHLAQWDARRLPFAPNSVNCLVSNLLWGRQASTNGELAKFYARLFDEINRVVCPRGVVVLLTTILLQDYLQSLYCVQKFEISLFGQTPTIWVLSAP
jgi:tRNA G10  N-methylase Trm11